MPAPRGVIPAEALPFTAVERAQASRQQSCQGQQVARAARVPNSPGQPRDGKGQNSKTGNSGQRPQPLAISCERQQSKPPLTPQEFCLFPPSPKPSGSLSRPQPWLCPCRSPSVLCTASDNAAFHGLWPFFAPKHKCCGQALQDQLGFC